MDGLQCILTFGMDVEFTAWTGRQHHHSHDTLAINDLAILFNQHFALKAIGRLDEQCRWTGMDAQFVGNHQFFGDLRVVAGFPGRTH